MFKVKVELEKDNFGRFAIEPLEGGVGHTLGNSLRRVLLTSLEGAAVTSVKIEGVSHQFSTIEGVSEDVIEILLNLKNLRVKVFSDKPVKLILKASGKRRVAAKDLEVVGEAEIVSSDIPVATLNSPSAKLNMELLVEKGRGYSPAGDHKLSEIGAIATDAIFSPVIDVNYKVEETRVGRRTDLDKLVLEIKTDGTVTPKEALDEAAKILSLTFRQIYEPIEEIEETSAVPAISDEVLKMSIEEIDLPVRITNALRAIDISSVEDLINTPKATLLKAKNLGVKSVGLISQKLSERGLALQ